MPKPYRQQGLQTIEQLFHALRTRLFNIQKGDIKKNKEFLWRKEDEENDEYYKKMIRSIVDNIFSFPALESLVVVNYCLKIVEQLRSDPSTFIDKIDFGEIGFNFAPVKEANVVMVTKVIGDELSYYSVELTIIRDQLEGDPLATRSLSSTDLDLRKSMNTEIGGALQESKPVSFCFSEKQIAKLKEIYGIKFESGRFIDHERTPEQVFIDILTSKNLSAVDGKIYCDCETTQIAYIIAKMKGINRGFTYAKIARSERFFTKNEKILNGNDISKAIAETPQPKGFERVDLVFKS